MDKQDFARLEFKMSFGQISHIAVKSPAIRALTLHVKQVLVFQEEIFQPPVTSQASRNDKKCKSISIFPEINSAQQGLILTTKPYLSITVHSTTVPNCSNNACSLIPLAFSLKLPTKILIVSLWSSRRSWKQKLYISNDCVLMVITQKLKTESIH